MVKHPALIAQGLSKRYRRPGNADWLALDGCSFSLTQGQSLGVVGVNGAGKSTLLGLLAGTLTPSTGAVISKGRVAALLELGAGFHPEFTGRENIKLSAALMGYRRSEIGRVCEETIAFAELGRWIDAPVKRYSSGMFARLAFASAVCGQPDVLIIDEALAVGDGAFARQSFERILALKATGCCLVLCSHALYQIETLCDDVLWLDCGQTKALGDAGTVLPRYEVFIDRKAAQCSMAATQGVPKQPMARDAQPTEPVAVIEPHRARITGVRLWRSPLAFAQGGLNAWFCDKEQRQITIDSGEGFGVSLFFRQDPTQPACVVAFTVSDAHGRCLSSVISQEAANGSVIELDDHGYGMASVFWQRLPLQPGNYYLGLVLGDEHGLREHESIAAAATIRIRASQAAPNGLVDLGFSAWLGTSTHCKTDRWGSARLTPTNPSGPDLLARGDGVQTPPRPWVLQACALSKHYGVGSLWQGSMKETKAGYEALQMCSFKLKRGQSLGLIGRNGAGKSTLLQLLAGTLAPSTGSVVCTGQIAALLELGAGFHPDFTGRENVALSVALLGLGRGQGSDLTEAIIEFAQIGAFIDEPVKTYSSGMFVRLTFAAAVCAQPDVLIIDEALAVGDGAFARKSFEHILALKALGCCLILCSHSMYQIEALCDEAMWLEQGRCVGHGPAKVICAAYEAWLREPEREPQMVSLREEPVLVLRHQAAACDLRLAVEVPRNVFTGQGKQAMRLSVCQGSLVIGEAPLTWPSAAVADNVDCLALYLHWPTVSLMKGRFELWLHAKDLVPNQGLSLGQLEVHQDGLTQGLFSIAHRWVPVIEALSELFSACFSHAPDAQWFRWKYASDPRFDGQSLWLFGPQGKLQAHYAGFARAMVHGAAQIPALQIGDVMVAPAARQALGRRNAFSQLTRSFFEHTLTDNQRYAYGFPNARHLRQGTLQGLYRASAGMYEASWVRKERLDVTRTQKELSDGSSGGEEIDACQSLAPGDGLRLFDDEHALLACKGLSDFDAFAKAVASSRQAASALRSLAYWRWRYPTARGYRWLVDVPEGAAILKPVDASGLNWELLDWLCLPEQAQAWMARCLAALEREHRDPLRPWVNLRCWCTQPLRNEFEALPPPLRPDRLLALDFEMATSTYPHSQHPGHGPLGFWMISGDTDFR